jgi:hypothetical protein
MKSDSKFPPPQVEQKANPTRTRSTKTVVLVQRIERGVLVREDRLTYRGEVEAVLRFSKGRAA